MAEKEFRLDPDSELRFEVESKKDTVDLKVSLFVTYNTVLDLSLHTFWLYISHLTW